MIYAATTCAKRGRRDHTLEEINYLLWRHGHQEAAVFLLVGRDQVDERTRFAKNERIFAEQEI